jgi:pSer/pThr/pTyr-binding forkhead associated (FHA) protein
LSVGRDPSSDIFLNDMTVSRAHAVLDTSPDGVSVRDAGSLNGTYVNGACVDQAQLREGDVLQIGTFQMVFHGGADGR